MIYDEARRVFVLSTGRTFKPGANRAIGLDGNEITVGYDSVLTTERGSDLTTEEKREIADYAISQWTMYRDSLTAEDRK